VAESPTRSGRSPVLLVVAGTGVVGLSGLLILVLAARQLDAEDYAAFGLFWSALYFVIAAVSGVQQEATRAAAAGPPTGRRRGTSLVTFALILAAVTGALVAATSPWWGPPTLGSSSLELALVVAIGSSVYVITAVTCAVLAASGRWGAYCALNMLEGVVRVTAVAAVLALAWGTTALAWAVVVAYPVSLVVVLTVARRGRDTPLRVGDSLGRLVKNTAQTLVAAIAVAALVNGFPLLMATFSRGASTATIGAMTLAVMLTRAPLLVPLVGAQSLLITMFAVPGRSPWPLVMRLVTGLAVIVAVLGSVAGLVGPYVLREVFGPNYELSGSVLVLLVISSGALGALSMTSPALLAANRHADYVAGWMVATAASVLVLAAGPWDLELRAPAALIVGPMLGLVWHLGGLTRHTGRRGTAGKRASANV
jgi:O-antigen/teichoic acid export membrane protein